MSVYFAAARSIRTSPVARVLAWQELPRSANDNHLPDPAADAILAAALGHFAVHGLGAAREAGDRARRALDNGDATGARKWLGVCRALDRGLAATLEARMTSGCAGNRPQTT